MTALLVLTAAVSGAVGGSLVTHRWHRTRTAELEHRASMCDWYRDVADRLAVRAEDAGRAVTTLRGLVADQAVIVRAALGRPQKRCIPGGTP